MKRSLFSGLIKKTGIIYCINSLLLGSFSFPVLSNQLTVNFQAIYTAATCSITVPPSISFNQGNYEAGIPSNAIEGENIQQTFNISFTDCQDTSATPGVPKITVSGNTTTLNGVKLFSDNIGTEGQAVGYGVKLSSPGNSLFNNATNLAENNIVSATQGTTVVSLNNQQLPVTAVLSCGSDTCGDITPRNGGTLTARVIFRLSYE
ncbi:hypothetical protein [Klebsiella sp. BIGb0407]|uniref:hypothetical protein n=1 Tax=Klebsiella sp. BIGb0407 TaxID=2940603 RepID=UPI002168F2B1|nr:hypothetical protein [Klebsiella sp. BIGb0407]MCS3429512.1 type 1 fimbria pilin [Klebsiella sp. BIGb0407]